MQILLDNPGKAEAIDGFAVSNYLNKYELKYGRSWTYLHRVILARLHNPQEVKMSTVYRIVGRELMKTPITIENGIRNLMAKAELNKVLTPKQFVEAIITDIISGTESEVLAQFKKK